LERKKKQKGPTRQKKPTLFVFFALLALFASCVAFFDTDSGRPNAGAEIFIARLGDSD
jgi:hypothetical protein